MSAYQQKPGFGALFKEVSKKSPNGPDYRGTFADLAGVQHEIAGWLRDGKNGQYLSLKIQLLRERAAQEAPAERFTSDLNDEIPF